jgi:hypothetical protein
MILFTVVAAVALATRGVSGRLNDDNRLNWCPQDQIISPSATCWASQCGRQSIYRPTPCTRFLDFGMPGRKEWACRGRTNACILGPHLLQAARSRSLPNDDYRR